MRGLMVFLRKYVKCYVMFLQLKIVVPESPFIYIYIHTSICSVNVSIAHYCMQFFPRIIFGLVKGEERGQGGGGEHPLSPLKGNTVCMYVCATLCTCRMTAPVYKAIMPSRPQRMIVKPEVI